MDNGQHGALPQLTAVPLWFASQFGIYQNWVSQAVCQCAALISPGLLESRGATAQLRAPYLVLLSSR